MEFLINHFVIIPHHLAATSSSIPNYFIFDSQTLPRSEYDRLESDSGMTYASEDDLLISSETRLNTFFYRKLLAMKPPISVTLHYIAV